ncbi:MarR family winged helix-turn-helix transcriptional regulator [Microbacterium album]|uniref:HTH marR-type domain-containing protein n=1 Tax=Microbacterium album TaxID=2053191 RepID=A0A917MLA2_9MICO|nr:MarR family transcriptional regulator [Microbacterium album]GGH36998.1 hypothetical protein GCM10010921_06550 [Microbacterium album]
MTEILPDPAHAAPPEPPVVAPPPRTLVGMIFSAERRVRGYLEDALSSEDVTPTEWATMFFIWRHGPISSAELARRAFVTPQAAGQLVGELERRGIATRYPDPNHGRKRLTVLTPEGRALALRCQRRVEEVEDHFTAALSSRERGFFESLFAVCVDHVSTHEPEPTALER